MTKKRKILFVIESLYLGGGSERSLLALLKYIDKEKYDIDLQVFYKGGELEKDLPEKITMLPEFSFMKFFNQPLKKSVLKLRSVSQIKKFISKVNFSAEIRKNKELKGSEKAQIFWENFEMYFDNNPKEYDIAIAFAQNLPTFYVADKVNAKHKIAWVNVTMQFPPDNMKFNEGFYKQFDRIIGITSDVVDHHKKFFPHLEDRFSVINNIIDPEVVLNAAKEEIVQFSESFNILTVSRFSKQKGYDILLNACKILKNNGIDFHWYILGGGELESFIKDFIKDNELMEFITLLGVKENPYPYFKAADLYVHTARHEGYGRTLAEARMLNLPIVTTNFDTVHMQMIHEKNGLITEMNPEAVANAIKRMMTDKNLYQSVVEYLKNEPKINTETVKKFDEMVQSLGSNE